MQNFKHVGNKIIYDPKFEWEFKDDKKLHAHYIPEIPLDENELFTELVKVNFTRVYYISRFGKANRTPRLTWSWGKINDEIINYRGLDFIGEAMPIWLEKLSQICRNIAIKKWQFDPSYNSCIIGRYDNAEDQIGFHKDDETFLEHHFCANVTLGFSRDFQFKDDNKFIHEIKLGHKSLFFFQDVEHAIPKRAGVKPGEVRYSISFRKMKNNIGIGNIFYYCRGLAGSLDNENKKNYEIELSKLQNN